MKIRTGFVSNSSSSSYVIKIVGDVEPCPTCGRSYPNVIDHIRNRSEYDYGYETSIQYDSKEQLLGDINAELTRIRKDIIKLSSMDPGEKPYSWSESPASDFLKSSQRELEQCQKRFDRIASISGPLFGVSIGYHDELTQKLFDEAIKAGAIELIEDRN